MGSKIFVILILFVCSFDRLFAQKKMNVLVFSKTEGGYRHQSIAKGEKMFLELAGKFGFNVDTTENASFFKDQNLKHYSVIVFLSTRGDILDSVQQVAFQNFIRNGGGFLGIHAATTTEYNWPWYNQLVGAYFDGHPEPQPALYKKMDTSFAAMRSFPDTLTWVDEIYNFRSVQDSLNYLLLVEENSYKGGKMGTFHPVCWYHRFDGGRSFYIGLGHFDAAYSNPIFMDTIYKALLWCSNSG